MSEASCQHDRLTTTVRFSRALRERGLAITTSQIIDAVKSLSLVDLGDRDEVYWGLRGVCTSRVEEFPIFDELFDAFWGSGGEMGPPRKWFSRASSLPAEAERPQQPQGPARRAVLSLRQWARQDEGEGEPTGLAGMSDQEVLAEKDFSAFGAEELEEITKVAARIARRLAARPSRRWKPTGRGHRINLRRTIRQSLQTGGEAVELCLQERRRRKTKLVVICDVSGSMDLYSRFLLQFLHALQNAFARVETFVFSTSLSRITDHLKGQRYVSALGQLSEAVHDWSGGTRIGGSLATFNAEWAKFVDRRSIVIILSDGWDTGEPERLAEEIQKLKGRAGRLIWLNPLLGSPLYQPLTRGMQAALPHLDVFAPAHNLASLQALERHLRL